MVGGMCGREMCVAGAIMVGGGGMHGRGVHGWGCVWLGGVRGRRDSHCSERYEPNVIFSIKMNF